MTRAERGKCINLPAVSVPNVHTAIYLMTTSVLADSSVLERTTSVVTKLCYVVPYVVSTVDDATICHHAGYDRDDIPGTLLSRRENEI